MVYLLSPNPHSCSNIFLNVNQIVLDTLWLPLAEKLYSCLRPALPTPSPPPDFLGSRECHWILSHTWPLCCVWAYWDLLPQGFCTGHAVPGTRLPDPSVPASHGSLSGLQLGRLSDGVPGREEDAERGLGSERGWGCEAHWAGSGRCQAPSTRRDWNRGPLRPACELGGTPRWGPWGVCKRPCLATTQPQDPAPAGGLLARNWICWAAVGAKQAHLMQPRSTSNWWS